MNASCYKIVFSKRLGTLVAVGEHTSSTGKAASGQGCRGSVVADGFVGALRFTFASVALACLSLGNTQAQSTPIASTALPQGSSVSTGSATISTQGAAMAITQSTNKASINWQSFNIGTGASVNIAQPSSDAVLLNRVVGNDPSQILGQLKANGQVILLNPNGVLFGKDGSVTASSFTASTFGLSDADFMAGYYKYNRNGSTAAVVNQGTIETSAGGFVALIGATVTNEGTIRAPQGDAVMAAAESVTLPEELVKPQPVTTPNTVSVRMSKRVRLELDPAAINTAVNNTESGVIVTEGGQVLLQAAAISSAVASVTHSGRIDTSAPQAGAVTVLAYNGVIKVDGSIKANSSGTDDQGQTRKGGDIIIGRDEETGVLARAANVSGATLESQGGFVETSGNYLATNGTAVKAKDWLLDPTSINIVASNTATPDTASSTTGNTKTFQDQTPNGSPSTDTSEVLKSTIESAINAGTNVTISTANPYSSGTGDITISTALSFTNTGSTDATLTLLAKNGITQNAGASITTLVASSKLVNIVMSAEGAYSGNPAASANSAGIKLNSTITTNGDVTLSGTTNNSGAASASNAIGVETVAAATITAKNISITGSSQSSFGIQSASTLTASGNITLNGTSKNWVGVTTSGVITATNGLLSITGIKGSATDAAGYQGININSNLTGASISLIGTSYGHYGIQVQNKTVRSTSGDIYIDGTGSNTATTTGQNESSGTRIAGVVDAMGKAVIKGTTSGAGLYQGLIISNQIQGASIEITGIAANHIGAAVNNGASLTARTGDVTIVGTSNINEGLGLGSQSSNGGATITATAGSVTLTGTSGLASLNKSGTAGVRFWGNNSVIASNAINITGNVDTQATRSGVGVEFQRYPSASSLKTTTGDINITGTLTGNGGGSGVRIGESGWGAQAPMISAGGNFTLRGNNRGSNSNASPAISASAGMQVSAGGNIVVQAEANNSAVAAMSFSSGVASVWGNALQANTSFATTKDVFIQTNQGGIVFNNNITSNLTNGTLTALTDIQGKNITIDNTGAGMVTGATNNVGSGSIDATTGAVTTAGSGSATGTSYGVTIDSRTITATGTGNLNIMGVATGTGIGISSNAVLTAGGAVNLDGKAVSSNGVLAYGALTSSSESVSVTGTSSTNTALNLQGTITANQNVNLTGTNTAAGNANATIYTNKAVTATNGTIAVTANTSGTTASALQLASGAGLTTTNGAITLSTDSLSIDTTGGAGANINAGTNTVNLQNRSSGILVSVGGIDVGSATTLQRTLGLSNAELNRISAANLIIGSDTAGNINISSATTTNAATGNITLQTGANITVNAALTVGDAGGVKNLTLNGARASSTITQTAPITATSLSLLGANATHTLTNASNSVTNLSANTGSLTLTNSSDLTVNAINASGTIRLETEGELDVTQAISTTNTTATAATLIAGKSTAAGTATGGDITFTGAGAISVGSGGRATLYTGSIAGSTGLGILAGFSRFNSSASSSGYTTALGSGTYAIYREAPTITGTIANVSKTYDGQTYTGGYTAAYSGFANGDTSAQLSGISYGGAAITAVNAGDHTISGTASNGLGYTVSYTNGTLTIDPKDITATYTAAHKTYDGSATASITNTTTGLITGDAASLAYTSASFADANAGTAKNVSITGISLTGADAGNYNLLNTSASASANILKKELSISGAIAADKVADGNTTATLTHLGTLSGFVSNETVLLSSLTGTFDTATAGTNKAVALSVTLANGAHGGLADNYALENTIIQANILAASGGGSNAKPAPIAPPKPILPTQTTDASEGGGNGDGSGGSSGNPYLLMPANRPNSADRCTPNALENCTCDSLDKGNPQGIAICYQPNKTASNNTIKSKRS